MDQTAIEIAEAVRRGERKAVDVLDEALAAIEAGNDAARRVRPRRRGRWPGPRPRRSTPPSPPGEDPGPFAGVPIGVKDLEDCAGMPTSHGSLAFAGRGPVAADSIHVARLRAAGAVPVGKTAAPEFGTLNFTKTKAFGVARNPWDTERTPGGSSGGSAAAVAAGLVPVGDGQRRRRLDPHPRRRSAGWSGSSPATGASRTPGRPARRRRCTACSRPPWPTAPATSTWSPGPDDRDRFSLAAAAVVGYEAADRVAAASRGLRARWSPDLGLRPLRSRGAGDRRGRRPASWPTPRAWCSTTSRSSSPTRCAPGWRRAPSTCGSTSRRACGPGVADDLTRYVPVGARADRGLPVPTVARRRAPRASSWSPTPPACSTRSTWCSRPPPRCRPSPPRARRPR